MNNKNMILVGNGLNRCVCNMDWEMLLREMVKVFMAGKDETISSASVKIDEILINSSIAFPLKFDMIASLLMKHSHITDITNDLKQTIAGVIKDKYKYPVTDNIIKSLTDLECDMMTTNYDHMLEIALKNGKLPDSNEAQRYKGNPILITHQHREINGTKVYHIHGEIMNPDTICLGYEHYARLLSRLRDIITKQNKNDAQSWIDTYKLGEYLSNKNVDTWMCNSNGSKKIKVDDTWAIKFFTHNIYMIGFGFPESEIDLWWLLAYRALRLFSNENKNKTYINNRIVFYQIENPKPEDWERIDNERKRLTLQSLGVEYIGIELKDSYENAYKDIIQRISNEIKK